MEKAGELPLYDNSGDVLAVAVSHEGESWSIENSCTGGGPLCQTEEGDIIRVEILGAGMGGGARLKDEKNTWDDSDWGGGSGSFLREARWKVEGYDNGTADDISDRLLCLCCCKS